MAEWTAFGNESDFDPYYHQGSVKTQGNKVKVWIIFNFFKPQMNEPNSYYKSVKFLQEIDCYNKTHRTLFLSTYRQAMGRGTALSKTNTPNVEWTPVHPDSIGKLVIDITCK